ncbi:MAG: dihydrofolate reductase [Lentisphaeraceae bacterium]|nr:dihydrofolate reductase [Lentisphaeraceae bacterium]
MATIIAAMDRNRLIGVDNSLPWRLSADLQNFKKLTTGNAIIMGRKTWDSLGKWKPLPNRHNIVITRNKDFSDEGCTVVNSLEEGIAKAGNDTAFIIGGGQIYTLALELADEMILTEVETEATGDAWFPQFDSSKWELTSKESFKADEKNEHDFSFCFYKKKA